MKINIRQLTYSAILERVEWLEKNIGERRYYLHNQSAGGLGWRYYGMDRTIEIEDERWATMFILKFGG